MHTAAGSDLRSCIGTGLLEQEKFTVPDSLHVKDQNYSLVSVGEICDSKRVVAFTANEAIILNIKKFSASEDEVLEVVPRDSETKVYVFPKRQGQNCRFRAP